MAEAVVLKYGRGYSFKARQTLFYIFLWKLFLYSSYFSVKGRNRRRSRSKSSVAVNKKNAWLRLRNTDCQVYATSHSYLYRIPQFLTVHSVIKIKINLINVYLISFFFKVYLNCIKITFKTNWIIWNVFWNTIAMLETEY